MASLSPDDLQALLPYAMTDIQRRYIEVCIERGSANKASKVLGVGRRTVDKTLDIVKKRAALRGWSPEHDLVHPVAEPFIAKGHSTLYKDGKPLIQWVKTSLDDRKRQQMMLEALESMKEDLPRYEPIPFTKKPLLENLLNCYVITDYHMGMLSWGEETGADWDLGIAEQTLTKWFEQAIAQAPNSKQCIFAQLSDFLHFDGMDAVTPASKHLLDVDTRFAKVVRTAIRVLRKIIEMLLNKYEHVHLIFADANHDPVSQIWLREWFSVLYENEPRITVDRSPSPYNAYEFGEVGLFFHHGHKKNVENVSEVFVAMFREMFGRTKYSYAHTGHLHSKKVIENNLMIVEQHRTLAAPDAYSARGGWISGRDAQVITYHKAYGEVSRLTINSAMLQ